MSNISHPSRRDFLKTGALLSAAAILPGALLTGVAAQETGSAADAPVTGAQPLPGKGKAKHLIVLNLAGGPPHTDMWDPKPEAKEGFKSLYKTIDTKVDTIKFTEVFRNLADRAELLTVINSMTSNEGNHDRARYLTHTSHAPNPSVRNPNIGAVLAKEKEDPAFELPGFISVGATVDAGFLGARYNPLVITNPDRGLDNIQYRKGDSSKRMERRLKLRRLIDEEFRKDRNAEIAEAQAAMYEQAKVMMDSDKIAAFDLEKESKESRDAYGRSNFGQGTLLARRLVEVGVSAVGVRLGGWDLHNDLFDGAKPLCEEVDRAMAALLDDLKKSGKLDETVVACFGEFGRTPRINGRNGRDHHARAWSMLVAGGPFKRGYVHGQTDDVGDKVISNPVSVPDFYHTLAHVFDFDPLRKFEVNERPIWYFDKAGKVVPELLA